MAKKQETRPDSENVGQLAATESKPQDFEPEEMSLAECARLIRELQRRRQELEELVAERTAELRQTRGQLRQEHEEREQIAEALQNSEEQARYQLAELESIYSSAPVGLCVFDTQGRYLRVNDRLAEFNGIPAAEHLGLTMREVIPALADQAEALLHEVITTGEPVRDVEISGATSGRPGVVRYWLAQLNPLKDYQQQVIGVSVSVEEITQRKQAEESLRLSRERLKLAMDSAKLGIYEWTITTGEMFWDERCREFWDLASEATENYEMFMAGVHPEDRVATQFAVDRALDPGGSGRYYAEHRVIGLRNGVERWIAATGEVFFHKDLAVRFVGTVMDITVRKEAEESLNRQYAILRGINRILQQSLTCETAEQLGKTCLAVAENLTGSRFGFIGEINEAGRLDCLAVSHLDREAGAINASENSRLAGNLQVHEIFGRCLKTGGAEIANDLEGHLQLSGVPAGQPPITVFLGVPLKQGPKIIGMIGLGNKPGGYTEADREIMDAINVATVQAFQRQRAEEALRASENRFRAFMDNSPAIAWAKDEAGRYIYLNKTFHDRFADQMEDPQGKTDAELWPPEVAEVYRQSDRAVLASGQPLEIIENGVTSDGSPCCWWISKFLFTGQAGDKYTGGIGVDVTARQRAEKALAASEERYRQLVEMSPDAILVHQNGRYVFSNPAGEALFGASGWNHLVGRGVLELIHPDFLKQAEKRLLQVKAGQPVEVMELQILSLDGTPVDVEISAVPGSYRSENAVQLVLRDITQRKEAEEALKQERDFSAALLNTLGALVVVLDRDGRIIRFNHACEITTGYSFAEVKDNYFGDIFLLPEEKPAVLNVFQTLLERESSNRFENYWHSRNGEKYLISWSNTALTDADGNVSYLIGTGIDISRQRQAEEALRQAYEELEERVAERTEQLRQTVDKLRKEIAERERAETNLQESEARFTAFMKNLPGSAIMRDRAGRFLFANEAWELELGREPGSTPGKTLDELWPPEIAEKLKELDRQVLSDQKPLETIVELPVHGENRTYLSYRFPIRNREGEVEMVGAIGIDITARLRAEEARDRLIEILEATPDFVGSADLEGRLFYLNRAAREMLGLGKEDNFTSLNYTDTMPAWALNHVLCEGRPVYLRDGFWQGKSAIHRRDGSEIPVSQVILVHRDTDGQIKFFSTICRDITEMQRAGEALRRSEEKLRLLTMQLLTAQEDERKRLAAELHDELGHALLILKLHLSEVEQKLLPDQAELKEKMAQIVEYLTETVAEVRRLYYALSPGDLEDLGLTTALRNLMEDFQELYPAIDWNIELSNIDKLFPLPVQTMIYRIVQEALTNIGKHAYPANVKITITKNDQRAIFHIEDDGRGFSMDDVLEGDKRGMGLAAMAQRVSLAGGAFDVWSLEDRGVRIIFHIPYASSGEKI